MTAGRPAVRIGVDFDNTLIVYDRVFNDVGRARGLLPAGFQGDKRAVRSHIRALPDGEARWTALQAAVYGPGVADAAPAEGALAFLAACRRAGAPVAIVSHKTAYAAADPGGVNLRDAARAWIERHGLTDPGVGGVSPEAIFFEDTREAKIARIAALGCSHFIDDLEEVFTEPLFPADIRRYLILHGAEVLPQGPFRACRHWSEITNDLFGPA
jgi:hypothetical protein